jgi:hypothetical protein
MITKTATLKSDIYTYTGDKLNKYFSNKELQANCTFQFPIGTLLYFIEKDPTCQNGWYFIKDNIKKLYSSEITEEMINIKDDDLIKLTPGYSFSYKGLTFQHYNSGVHSYWVAEGDVVTITIDILDSGLIKIGHVLKIKPENFVL